MSLVNLADSHWVSVDCNIARISNIVCSKRSNGEIDTTVHQTSNNVCHQKSISKGENCYFFRWFDGDVMNKIDLHEQCNKFEMKVLNLTSIARFEYIFNAVSETQFSIVSPILTSSTYVKMLSYKRILFDVFYEENLVIKSKAKGFYVCSKKQHEVNINLGNVFQCTNGQIISSLYVLDGKFDCYVTEDILKFSSDEKPLIYGLNFLLECLNINCPCSPLHVKSTDGKCISYTFSNAEASSTVISLISEFHCFGNHTIPYALVNDLAADCPKANDEPIYKSVLKNSTYYECQSPRQLPCFKGHFKCFNFSDICIYKLNEYGHLSPCRTGSHLESCKDFECPMYFKCLRYYCVLWSMVCDGKWDCPHGDDEHLSHKCGDKRLCMHFFKCKFSQICVHAENVCDGIDDCPLGDDELLCEIKTFRCPKQCFCLNLAIMCQNQISGEIFSDKLPHISFHITGTSIASINFLRGNNFIVSINLSKNRIMNMIPFDNKFPFIITVDLGYNYITKLEPYSFSNLSMLRFVILRNNLITLVKDFAFYNLKHCHLIDLSNNNLQSLPRYSFVDTFYLNILNLTNNPLFHTDISVFSKLLIKIIASSNPVICCIKPSVTFCDLSTRSSYASCTSLFSSAAMTVSCLTLSVVVVLLNALTFCVHALKNNSGCKRFGTKRRGSGIYELIVCIINFVNFMVGTDLMVFGTVHLYYGKNFIIKEYIWIKSIICFIVYTFTLIFNLCLPLLFWLLAFARLMVILYPIESKFRSRTFVLKQIIFPLCTIALFSVCIALYSQTNGYTNNKLCSPFIDPTKSLLQAKVLSFFAAVFHAIIIVSMPLIYLLLYTKLKQLQKSNIFNSTVRAYSFRFGLLRSVLIAIPNVACWILSDTLFISFLFIPYRNTEILTWGKIFILPLTGIVNPIFFLITVKRS